jgi:DNA (cytosine-5)-methyltransferase 1
MPQSPHAIDNGLTFTDIFCGAGGSSIGLTEAGFRLVLAANHWQRAIDTHAANFTHAEHLCADVNNYDMRRLPTTDVLWASPICTEASPSGAGGGGGAKYRQVDGQVALGFDGEPVEQAGYERTRATFHDVIRATEVHRYKAVIVENVPDVAWKWELYSWWLTGMQLLGYNVQIVSVSSAHVGDEHNPFAPQWRNRKYIVATREGIPLPDVKPRPLAWCQRCGTDVHAQQWWKPKTRLYLGQPVGKYRQQYLYQCPTGHAFVEPYVLPAASVIDWDNLGPRLGDRKRLPVAKTLARIEAGLSLLREAALITVNHSDGGHRAVPLARGPLPTRTVHIGEGIATHPLLVPCGGSRYDDAADATQPFRTRLTRESEAVLTPPAFIAQMRNHCTAAGVDEPLTTMTTSGRHHYLGTVPQTGRTYPARDGRHALVVPYRSGNVTTTADEPLLTMATKTAAGIARPGTDGPELRVEDCHFRMLTPREQLRSQRFPDTYHVTGTVAEQTMQAGNAVSANVAHWLGRQVAAALA